MSEPRTIEEVKELYRSDFLGLIETFGANDIKQVIDDLAEEAELIAKGMSRADIRRIQDAWGAPYEHE